MGLNGIRAANILNLHDNHIYTIAASTAPTVLRVLHLHLRLHVLPFLSSRCSVRLCTACTTFLTSSSSLSSTTYISFLSHFAVSLAYQGARDAGRCGSDPTAFSAFPPYIFYSLTSIRWFNGSRGTYMATPFIYYNLIYP